MTAIAFFGEHPRSIRLLELVIAIPALGFCAARVSQGPGEPARADSFAVGSLAVSVTYYGYFTYWDTAQCEIWSALFVALAMVAALHGRPPFASTAASGALCAVGLFTKPPILFFVVLCGALVARRAHGEGGVRRVVYRLLQWTLGMGFTAAVLLGYFAARGALADLIDIVVRANAVYVPDERTYDGARGMLGATASRFSSMRPFSGLFVVVVSGALALGLVRRDWALLRRYALPLLLAFAAYAGVVMQLKFYDYHWGT